MFYRAGVSLKLHFTLQILQASSHRDNTTQSTCHTNCFTSSLHVLLLMCRKLLSKRCHLNSQCFWFVTQYFFVLWVHPSVSMPFWIGSFVVWWEKASRYDISHVCFISCFYVTVACLVCNFQVTVTCNSKHWVIGISTSLRGSREEIWGLSCHSSESLRNHDPKSTDGYLGLLLLLRGFPASGEHYFLTPVPFPAI